MWMVTVTHNNGDRTELEFDTREAAERRLATDGFQEAERRFGKTLFIRPVDGPKAMHDAEAEMFEA